MNLLLTDPTNALIQCYLFQTVNYLSSSKYTMTYKALSRSAISALQIVWYHLLRPIKQFPVYCLAMQNNISDYFAIFIYSPKC